MKRIPMVEWEVKKKGGAKTTRFVLSGEAGFLTGQIIRVDGGITWLA